MEARIQALPEVKEATITFTTNQLQVVTEGDKDLLEEFQKICAAIESEVIVKRKVSVNKKEEKKKREQEQQEKKREQKRERIEIVAGAGLFLAGILLKDKYELFSTILFVSSYLMLGWEILLTAGKNICKGRMLDENFLMSIATLGAFAIQEYAEAVGVMLFYRIGEMFEHIAVEKSRGQIMSAVDLRPEVVSREQNGVTEVIPAEQAQVGDLLIVRPGDRIPLDGTVIDGESRIDTSPVTGEPVPVKVEKGDSLVSGCVNTSGLLKMRVEKVLEDSMVTRILDSVEHAAASKPKIDKFITRFARVYTPFVVALALATAILPSLVTGNWSYWVYTALTFLVISCPCALVLSVPLAFFSGIGAGSKRGILFKGGVAIEALQGVKTVVMDKTGTITEGNFVVQKCVANEMEEEELLRLAAVCEKNSTHPIGTSILLAAEERKVSVPDPERITEISGKGIEAVLDGRQILCGNQKLMEQYQVDLTNGPKGSYGTEVLVAVDGEFAGFLVISDTIKKDAVSAVQELKRQKIRTAMLTGDAKESAEAVAEQTGIDEVHARLLPEEKLGELTKIREQNGSVMFVGDGINDAPVLAGADVGAAMGSGADAAIEAADVVFMTSSMEAIPASLEIARSTNRIAKQNVLFALAIKVVVMVLGLAGFADMWLAVFADTGVAMLCVLNSIRILYKKK
ncbi:cadmium-translocating P-type ATPase [Coprococcus sp. AM25-15LB]|nr:cadmium-translocating P-type ATPase [Coprococcus sp. AM25-15LB]RJW06735.1 cadmium-translocating P-type ATPase [Coprococcus sp. AM25-4LB]